MAGRAGGRTEAQYLGLAGGGTVVSVPSVLSLPFRQLNKKKADTHSEERCQNVPRISEIQTTHRFLPYAWLVGRMLSAASEGRIGLFHPTYHQASYDTQDTLPLYAGVEGYLKTGPSPDYNLGRATPVLFRSDGRDLRTLAGGILLPGRSVSPCRR